MITLLCIVISPYIVIGLLGARDIIIYRRRIKNDTKAKKTSNK